MLKTLFLFLHTSKSFIGDLLGVVLEYDLFNLYRPFAKFSLFVTYSSEIGYNYAINEHLKVILVSAPSNLYFPITKSPF